MFVFTIGHSNKQIELFIVNLKIHNIDYLVDVRTYPYSRFCPQYNQKQLKTTLNLYGIEYDFRGRNLGGKKENVNYEEALNDVIQLSKSNKVVVMCSEADFLKCHRHTVIGRDLMARGVGVRHISYTKPLKV